MPQEKAKAAADSTEPREARIDHINEHLARTRTRLEIVELRLSNDEAKLTELNANLDKMQWILGGVGFVTLLLAIKIFWPA